MTPTTEMLAATDEQRDANENHDAAAWKAAYARWVRVWNKTCRERGLEPLPEPE